MANSEQLAEAGLCLNHCMCCLRPFPLTSQWILSVVTGLLILSWASDGVCSPSKDTPRQQFVWSMKHLSSRPEKDTNRFFFSFSFFFFVIWNISGACVCALSVQSSLPLHFSLAPQFQQDYYCSLFYQVWQTCQRFIFRAVLPWDLGIPSTGAQNRLSRCFWHVAWCLTRRFCL